MSGVASLMKAFVFERYGKGETGRVIDVPTPTLRDDDVLVEVHAAGVNVLDVKIRNGEFKPILPYRLPLILGHDIAGRVVGVGPGVRGFRVGDEVHARPDDFRIGGFAQYIAVREGALARKPANLIMVEAASLIETAALQRGQKVFIEAGSGGVGTVAIQLARHLGAFVATSTGTANVEWVRALGADVVIDHRTQDVAAELRDHDVVLHSLGSDALATALQVLRPGGRLVSISGPPTPAFAERRKLSWLLRQGMRVLSHGIRRKAARRGVAYDFVFMRADGAQLARITELVETGAIRPTIDRVFPFEATANALAHVARGHARGKVVVQVR